MRAVAESLYPFQGRFLDVGEGVRLHYLDEGRGESLVLLHGNPTWSFYYRRLVLALRGRYRLTVPDHVGCGYSDMPSDAQYPYRLERRVQDLEALLDHLQLERGVTLVVHDWGGMIGLALAVRRPARIARLIVMNTAAFPMPADKRFPLTLALCRGALGACLVRGLNLFCRGTVRIGTKRAPLAPDVRTGYLAPYDSWAHRIAVHRFVQDIPLHDTHPSMPLVADTARGLERLAQVPMCIFWGARDFVFDEPFLVEWRRRFPHAEVHRFADAGHLVLEDAFDDILPRLEAFLAKHPLAPLGVPARAPPS